MKLIMKNHLVLENIETLQGTGDYCNLIVMAQDTLQAANCCNTSLLEVLCMSCFQNKLLSLISNSLNFWHVEIKNILSKNFHNTL